jgi:hypothetical protein
LEESTDTVVEVKARKLGSRLLDALFFLSVTRLRKEVYIAKL